MCLPVGKPGPPAEGFTAEAGHVTMAINTAR